MDRKFKKSKKLQAFYKRQKRVRYHIQCIMVKMCHVHKLTIYKSNTHLDLQIINIQDAITVVHVSSMDKALLPSEHKNKKNKKAAEILATALAEKALENGIKFVVLDRGAHRYHGFIRTVAEVIMKNGLSLSAQ